MKTEQAVHPRYAQGSGACRLTKNTTGAKVLHALIIAASMLGGAHEPVPCIVLLLADQIMAVAGGE